MTRLYEIKCRDCDYEQTARNPDQADHLYKSHKGQTGHIITQRGPFYECKGNCSWECEKCGFTAPRPEQVREHITDEHDPVSVYLSKTNEPQD